MRIMRIQLSIGVCLSLRFDESGGLFTRGLSSALIFVIFFILLGLASTNVEKKGRIFCFIVDRSSRRTAGMILGLI